jgi:hypothetical protein
MNPTRGAVALLMALTLAIAGCSASVSPSPSLPAETPSPPPPNGDEVIAAFLAVTGDPALTMHVVADGKVTVSTGGDTENLTIGFDMDISGEDGVGQGVVDTGPSDLTFDMLLVDGRAYVDDNGTWTEIPDYQPSTPLNPFAGLSGPADLTYRGAEEGDAGRVHHLSVEVWLGGDLGQLEEQGWTGLKVDYELTTLTADDQGHPIEMSFSGGVSGRYQGVSASAAFEVSYEFSAIGEPVEIPSPSTAP